MANLKKIKISPKYKTYWQTNKKPKLKNIQEQTKLKQILQVYTNQTNLLLHTKEQTLLYKKLMIRSWDIYLQEQQATEKRMEQIQNKAMKQIHLVKQESNTTSKVEDFTEMHINPLLSNAKSNIISTKRTTFKQTRTRNK